MIIIQDTEYRLIREFNDIVGQTIFIIEDLTGNMIANYDNEQEALKKFNDLD